MGNSKSSGLSEEERNRLDKELEGLEKIVRITYKSHFESSQYYGNLAQGLELFVTILIPSSTTGLALSLRANKQPNIAVVGLSLLGFVFSGLQKFESSHSKYHPAIKQELHFKAGIQLSAFYSEVIAFRQLWLRDPTLTRQQFVDEHANLIEKKRQCDEIIQTETWAYIRARNRDHSFAKMWKTPQSKEANKETARK